MYYSKHIADMRRQERNPVNKMYLSEIALKWKNFQQIADEKKSSNAQLAESLSLFLAALQNRKFNYNRARGSGFPEDSPIFSPNYLYDLLNSIMQRQDVIQQKGVVWDFQSFNFAPAIIGGNIAEIAQQPVIAFHKAPQALALSVSLDFQYRVAGKRNFTKDIFILPLMMFYVFPKLTALDLFNVRNYCNIILSTCSSAKVFVLCESLSEIPDAQIKEFPGKIYVMKELKGRNDMVISLNVINTLEKDINTAINDKPPVNLIKMKQMAVKKPKTTPRKKTYPRKK